MDYLDSPQVEVQSSSIETQSMHAGLSNPAFVQHEVRGHSTQVGIAAPLVEHYVPGSELWTDRVVYQRMRMSDLQNRGVSHIEDQTVAFYNGQVIDLLRMRTLGPQGQTAAAPNTDDRDGDNEDDDDNGTNRRSHNRGGHSPPLNQNLGGHGPPLLSQPTLPPN